MRKDIKNFLIMVNLRSSLATLITILLFYGCTATPSKSKSVTIYLKTKQFKYYDIASINSTTFGINTKIYNFGNMIFELKISPNKVCIDKRCYSLKEFNYIFLSDQYPNHILEHIFNAKPIFNSQRITNYNNGFTQYIKNNNVNISYKVDRHKIYFKDSKNSIKIIIKDLN